MTSAARIAPELAQRSVAQCRRSPYNRISCSHSNRWPTLLHPHQIKMHGSSVIWNHIAAFHRQHRRRRCPHTAHMLHEDSTCTRLQGMHDANLSLAQCKQFKGIMDWRSHWLTMPLPTTTNRMARVWHKQTTINMFIKAIHPFTYIRMRFLQPSATHHSYSA